MGHSEAAESVERAFALRIFLALQCATQEERALGSSPQLLYLGWKSQLLLDPMSESTPTPHPTTLGGSRISVLLWPQNSPLQSSLPRCPREQAFGTEVTGTLSSPGDDVAEHSSSPHPVWSVPPPRSDYTPSLPPWTQPPLFLSGPRTSGC